ncbi:NADH dehydrogenase subunit N [Fibrobacter sp. UWH9]|uniref:NADH-quinone oxidoreductase subunit N n=1 Tax=unclassified Fibrobacter TaxID=2634177 RepID=UPI000915CAD1|nr:MULTISPECIES: NADH-quinone oxidoreductase subunit N [Fibrobacter]MCQ2100253.1 NADH-quinone oxidoreductase subunit N [Fibrobacter sp.]MCL4103352.1 NAD(P)H-quinone oxidoreductase subunit 2, chloroplastic [Fibrobacter succinogenes]MDO4948045.1 NADH-quinone oxidoreductase subunit N [Fibrobacter sp.]OWV03006.1 NADH-quinone oxidoreductase subunit N [Fibrobacter sp. UWH3]OWV08949.1 NADH-quinone oxidoreductase subunit N [Fibrobacter sp. UWH1]
MSNMIILLPVILVAVGALISLAAEPFIKDENKHKILPWVASAFALFAAGAYALVTTDTFYGLYAMDPARRLLGVAIVLCAFLGIAGLQWTLGHEKFKGGEAYALLMLATTGALLMTQAIDYVALFLGMELASFPIYALVGIRRKDANANEGAFKYFVSGSIFSAIFLYGVAMVYGATGTTSFNSAILPGRESIYGIGVFMTVIGLLFKAGAAPVHFWVADVYTGASVAVTGFMAAVVKVGALAALASVWLGILVTKAGSAAAWNLAEQVTIGSQSKGLYYVVVIVALLSMVFGAFGGLAQKSIRRILAYSAVMNAGFIVIGLLLPNYAANGTVQMGPMFYFLVTYAVASAGALTGIAYLSGRDDRNETLEAIQGRGRKRPFVALGVTVCLASLAGLPPVAGFLAKFTLFTDAFAAGMGWLAAVAFGLSLVAAVFYLRIAFVLFMPLKPECECKCVCAKSAPFSYLLKFAVTVAAIALLVVGVIPGIALI